MHDAIDTDRMRLRPFISDDVQFAFDWFGDPLVMRFTPSGPDRSMEQTAARIANYKRHQSEHGFSKWIIIERGSGRPIGDADYCCWLSMDGLISDIVLHSPSGARGWRPKRLPHGCKRNLENSNSIVSPQSSISKTTLQ
jgi:Acetyltransferase (GNAT) domain